MVEPWLRGTHREVDAVRRQVLHALELTGEDADRWCAGLRDDEVHVAPYGVASVAFHLRHIVRSLDRLLTYAEAHSLSGDQMEALGTETIPGASAATVLEEFRAGVASAAARVMRMNPATFEEARGVGRAMLPSSVGGLLVHCAEHTQRHAGQMVTTAKIVWDSGRERCRTAMRRLTGAGNTRKMSGSWTGKQRKRVRATQSVKVAEDARRMEM